MSDVEFAGGIPEIYQRLLVPLIFQPYADDLAARVARLRPQRVLELACGTGVVTRALDAALDPQVELVATDLNPPMLEVARRLGAGREVTWAPADAQQLHFADGSFDVVVCQFGVMFFPDKPAAFAEMARVARPGGTVLFNVWDSLATNDPADAVNAAVGALFGDGPSPFMARLPHGYFDEATIRSHLAAAGLDTGVTFETVSHRARVGSTRDVAVAFCQGTPMRTEIESRGVDLAAATDAAEAELVRRSGDGPYDGGVCAHVVTVTLPG